MVHPRWVQLFRAVIVFMATGWSLAVAVRITDSGTSVQAALFGLPTLRCALLGLAVGLPWAPLAAWPPSRGLAKIGQGALAGALAGAVGVWLYFWLWPPEWNAGTVATLKVFYATYGLRVGPLSTLGGVAAALWSARVQVPPPLPTPEG